MTILFLYASHDGHTARIARRIREVFAIQHCPVLDFNLGREEPAPGLIQDASLVLILAPIRYGFHLKPIETFIKKNIRALRAAPLAMASVNLTARKPEKNTPATNPYFRKWIRRHRLKPAFSAVFGGKLDYKRYPSWEKWIIRFIMTITKGPTQLDACVDFTDWHAVRAFAESLAEARLAKEEAA